VPPKDVAEKISSSQKDFEKGWQATNSMVAETQDFLSRLQQISSLLPQMQPGAFAPERNALAAHAKDLAITFGMSPKAAQSMATSIAGGNIAAYQTMQTQLIDLLLKNLRSDLQTDSGASAGRLAVSEFQNALKTKISGGLDPATFPAIMSEGKRRLAILMAEQRAYSTWNQQYMGAQQKGQLLDLSQFKPWWDNQVVQRQYITPQPLESMFSPNSPTAGWDWQTDPVTGRFQASAQRGSNGQPVWRWVQQKVPQQ